MQSLMFSLQSKSRAIQALRQKLFNSRFLTISVLFHLVLLVMLGGTVIMKQATEPPDFTGGDGDSKFVQNEATFVPPPPPPPETPALTPAVQNNTALDAITTVAPTMTAFQLPAIVPVPPPVTAEPKMAAPTVPVNPQQLTTAQAKRIRDFTSDWSKPVKGFGGLGSSVKERQFQFVAYLAKYQGGDWASTNIIKEGQIVKGSLPNLLYFMNKLSKGRIKADAVPVPLDLSKWEEEVSVKKPPFIFFTGHRDFVLTDAEVDCLQKYVQSGGCVWGDSSLPGRHSRFDLAFRREMRRVIPDLDKDWEVLPPDYPMFKKNLYYNEITAPTSGVNHYKEPVYALRFGGEVAIIYTANDYGDMWRMALAQAGDKLQFDLTLLEDRSGQYKYSDNGVFARMEIYYRGMELPQTINSYKFGTNVVIHLLTRWEDRIKAIPQGL